MKIKVLMLDDTYMDQQSDIIPTTARVGLPDRRIWLHKDFNLRMEGCIGSAVIFREGNDIYIEDIQIVDKEYEKNLNLTFPAVGGSVIGRNSNLVTDLKISMVSFNFTQNVDSRIKSIGDQLKESYEQ